ncbi:hypothetical protein PR003_g13858 [Phytophthora rubi]|uniref:RNase H type-1 domain-containing protein n=2 Tax=Phytophthora rubi TaxID=129364 RepID=A0A6A3LVR7_9STRA|nr:hypothetical protein PR001_g12899 [Phytophthora rubi]KAE9333760.1 hypothetical protein PR003_g13858 [Phytophthora rubi]
MQLGLLRGLRQCVAHAWGPVHVVGDNHQAVQQLTRRRPPRGVHLRDTYWKARRAADAAAVTSWTRCHRDANRAATGFASMARETDTSVESRFGVGNNSVARWATITDAVQADVTQWAMEQVKTVSSEAADSTV